MDREKDRFGDKLRDAEKAREDKYFADRDRELLAKLRSGEAESATCPQCKEPLEARADGPLRVHACRRGHGAWISREDAAAMVEPGAPAALARLLGEPGTR